MHQSLQKIAYILLLFLVLPVIAYSVFEYSQMNKNEKVLSDIYNKQLETILFSVNQYADDMVGSWANKIVQAHQKNDTSAIHGILNNIQAAPYIFVADSDLQKPPEIIDLDSGFFHTRGKEDSLLVALRLKSNAIAKLFKYFQAGYQKIDPLIVSANTVILVFVDSKFGTNGKIYGIALDAPKFVKLHLGPRISGIVGTDFVADVRDSVSNINLYSSSITDSLKESYSKQLWIIPKYKLIIGSSGISVNQIVAQRTKTNFVILISLATVLLLGAFVVFFNISKQIKLAELKSEFVSNVSHEIRTPLAIIKLYIETLQMRRASPEKTDEYYNILNHETSRLTNLVNRILSFSQIESKKKKYNFTDVNVNELMLQIKETYLFHLQSKGFETSFEIEKQLPFIFGDREAITEMVVNLLDNAIKYSPNEKRIIIKAYKNEKFVNVEVHDHGIGIAQKHQKQIFEEFFRVPSNLVHNTKGTGLGLSIVKQMMDEHKGKIIVSSTLGNGSCFRLCFPVKLIN